MKNPNYIDDIRADDLVIEGDQITEWENAMDMMDPEVAFGELWSDDPADLDELMEDCPW